MTIISQSASLFAFSSTTGQEKPVYKPTNVHHCVGYTSKDDSDFSKLNPGKKMAYNLINKYYQINDHFESNKAMGPLSGITFHQRVLSAYQNGQLELYRRDEGNGRAVK